MIKHCHGYYFLSVAESSEISRKPFQSTLDSGPLALAIQVEWSVRSPQRSREGTSPE